MKEIIKCLFIYGCLILSSSYGYSQQKPLQKREIILKVEPKYINQRVRIYAEWPSRRLLDSLTFKNGVTKIAVYDSVSFVGQILVLSKPLVSSYFVVEKDPVNMVLHADSMSVEAGKANAILHSYMTARKSMDKEMVALGRAYIQEHDLNKKIAIGDQTSEIFAKTSAIKTDFILAHINTVYGQWLAASNANVLRLEDLLKIKQKIGADKEYAAVNGQLQKAIDSKTAGLKVGQRVPDFTLRDVDGKEVALVDVLSKNRYVLLDFWASWCVPCRAKNRKITPIYEALKKKGIEVISISVDKQEALWRKAIKDDQVSWIQLRVDGEMKNPTVQAYGVRSLPATFLVNQEGKILKMGVEEGDLQKLE